MTAAKITKIATVHFAHQIQDMGTDYNRFHQVYKRTSRRRHDALRRVRIDSDASNGTINMAGTSSLSYKSNPTLDSVSTSDAASLKDAN